MADGDCGWSGVLGIVGVAMITKQHRADSMEYRHRADRITLIAHIQSEISDVMGMISDKQCDVSRLLVMASTCVELAREEAEDDLRK